MKLWLDFETFNEADIDVGTYRYAEAAEILLAAYAIDDGPVSVHDVTTGETAPIELATALLVADEVWAHGAQFDRTVMREQWAALCPDLPRWRCTMAQALSHALPAGLSSLCSVLDVPEEQAKLAEGHKLLMLFTKPQAANRKVRRATRLTHPAEWARFIAYAANDIEAMRECHRRMPKWNWNASAIAEWHCDQRINDRGFAVDLELTRAGVKASEIEKARLAARFAELTGGTVRPTQRAQFMGLLNERFGLALDNTRSDTFLQLLKGKLPADCAELMQLSIASNKTSTAKYASLDAAVSRDGRFRGGLQFAGAGRTRRWAGRVFQAQNLPARGLPKALEVETYIGALKAGVHDLLFADLMKLSSAAIRGCVVAEPGKVLNAADLSNIEGRKLAWIADEKWKLEAFREYDAGLGPDLYNITAVSIIGGDPWKVPKQTRNVFGKVPDLASGYRGGVAGYQKFARTYNVRMADHWETMRVAIAPELIEKALFNFDKWGHTQIDDLEIDKWEWVASETCKLAWRGRHPATVKFWYAIQDACINAIRNWGGEFRAGRLIKVRCVTYKGYRWLVIALPSGRYLTYFNPRINREGTIVYEGEAAEEGKTTRIWIDVYTHGGKLTGNCCQTLARDLLAESIPRAEAAGYLPVLTVHDELVCESPDTPEFGSEGLVAILAKNPAWAKGLPLAAAGYRAYRYKKED